MAFELNDQFSGMPMFDGHSDIWSDVDEKRSVGETKVFNRHHRDQFIEGNIFGAIFALWVNTEIPGDSAEKFDRQLTNIKAELEDVDNGLVIINSAKTYQTAMMNFINDRSGYGDSKPKIAVLMGLEGLDGLNDRPEKIEELYALGFRHLSLTWNLENNFATGVQGPADRGLTDAGRQILRFADQHPMLLDVSHANDKTFWDIVGTWKKPILASHSNAKSLCDAPRNLTDKQIKAIGASGGLVGLNSYSLFVSHDPKAMTVEKLAEHASHMADLIGTAHVGLGFDFVEYLEPHPTVKKVPLINRPGGVLENCSQAELMLKALQDKGFNDREIFQIAHGNFGKILSQL